MDKVILKKAASFCAYQERTHDEVRKRLNQWKVYGDEAEEIIARLIEEDFLNELRFVKAYAGGKFRVKKWGKNKILFELKSRKISSYCIQEAFNEINDDEYKKCIQDLIVAKQKSLDPELPTFENKNKIFRYLIGKGFESELIAEALQKAKFEN